MSFRSPPVSPATIDRLTTLLNQAGTSTASFLRTPSAARTALGAFLGLYALGRLNGYLSRRVLNNYNLSHKWNFASSGPDSELVVVTGGSGGIGAAVARQLAAKGVRVVILDVNEPKAALQSHVRFYKCDVTSSAAVKEVAGRIRKDLGGDPTVLVNNAGVGCARAILDESEAETRKTFEVNVLAHFVLLREFLPAMVRNNHGHVVTVASMASFVTIASNVDYSCSKAAVLALHEGLGQELRYRYNAPNVRTSVIHPNWVRTPMVDQLFQIPGRPWTDHLLEVDDVAGAIVQQILKGESGQIILPSRVAIVASLLRGLPIWFQDGVRASRRHLLDVEKYRAEAQVHIGNID